MILYIYVCLPVSVSRKQAEYVIGSLENLEFEATVQNFGEDAFQSRLSFSVPKGSSFSWFSVLGNTTNDVTPFCSVSSGSLNQEMSQEVSDCIK